MKDGGDRKELLLRLGRLKQQVRELEDELHLVKPAGLPSLPAAVQETMSCLITEYSADLLSVHAMDGEYAFASPNCERFFGWTSAELLGRSAYEFFHPDDLERIAADHAMHGQDGADPCVTYRLRCRSGDYRWVETRSRSTADGRYIVCITRDVHTQVEDQENRRRTEQGLLEELRLLAHRDVLTGLANRFALEQALEHELERARRKAHVTLVVLFDVDRFKRINDLFGHERGDAVLRLVGGVIGSLKRAYDTAGRWGGDEFLLVLPETPLAEAELVAERVREAVERIPPEDFGPLSVSGGVSSSEQGAEWGALLRLADMALYQAKEQGRNRIVLAQAVRSA